MESKCIEILSKIDKKKVLKSKLITWNIYDQLLTIIKNEIENIDDKIYRVRGISFKEVVIENGSSQTREQILNEHITKKAALEKDQSTIYSKKVILEKELQLDKLNEQQYKLLKTVYKFNSYVRAGKKIGASKATIYREMNIIYEELMKVFKITYL